MIKVADIIELPRSNREPVRIPKKYSRIDLTQVEDAGLPEDALCYRLETEEAISIVVCNRVSAYEAMPFEHPEAVIDYLHTHMGENRGIIEVKNGRCKHGGEYIYYIAKFREPGDTEDSGTGYQLNFNLKIGNQCWFVSGSFQEAGVAGTRDSMAYGMIKTRKIETEDALRDFMENEWFEDPYDPDYKKGYRMSISEKREYDRLYPGHPLTVARALVQFIVEHN